MINVDVDEVMRLLGIANYQVYRMENQIKIVEQKYNELIKDGIELREENSVLRAKLLNSVPK